MQNNDREEVKNQINRQNADILLKIILPIIVAIIGWFVVDKISSISAQMEKFDNRLDRIEGSLQISTQWIQKIGAKVGVDVDIIGHVVIQASVPYKSNPEPDQKIHQYFVPSSGVTIPKKKVILLSKYF